MSRHNCILHVSFVLQVRGFKLGSLEHLSALKSYDGKTTLAQLMVVQVTPESQQLHAQTVLTSTQLGAQCTCSLIDDLSQCASAALINVHHLLETCATWGSRVEHAVLCVVKKYITLAFRFTICSHFEFV